MHTTNRRVGGLALAAIVAASVAAGCSSTTGTAASSTTTSAASAPSGTDAVGTPASASLAGVCDAYVGVTAAIDSGDADPAEVEAMLATIDSDAPAPVADALTTMTTAARGVLASGGQDTTAFEDPAFQTAKADVDGYLFENCEFDNKIEVSGKEFEFVGLPDTLEAGRTAILFTNEGDEAHELALARRLPGVTEPWETILEAPDDQVESLVAFAGQTFAPTAGSKAMIVSELVPGNYLAVCFIPSGTTMDDTGMHEGTGQPHVMAGMQQQFTVT